MKNNNENNLVELTKAKELLESIEGGLYGEVGFPSPSPFPGPICNFLGCTVPMYGTITDPRWEILIKN